MPGLFFCIDTALKGVHAFSQEDHASEEIQGWGHHRGGGWGGAAAGTSSASVGGTGHCVDTSFGPLHLWGRGSGFRNKNLLNVNKFEAVSKKRPWLIW